MKATLRRYSIVLIHNNSLKIHHGGYKFIAHDQIEIKSIVAMTNGYQ